MFSAWAGFGLAVRRVRLVSRGTSVRIRFGSPFSSKVVVCGHCLVTLSLTINETLKWLSTLPTLMQGSFWWWQCSDRYIISLSPHLNTPFPPFSPSLISLMVSVDVKHHVHLLSTVIAVLFHWGELYSAIYAQSYCDRRTWYGLTTLSSYSLKMKARKQFQRRLATKERIRWSQMCLSQTIWRMD